MTQAIKKLTFEEYADLDAEAWTERGLPEGRCEYVDEGELNELPSESELNDWIAQELFWLLAIGIAAARRAVAQAVAQLVPRRLIRPHSCEIEVLGKPRTRFPDLVILREEHLELTKKRLFVRLTMPPPRLVAEVVSPGDDNYQRDYEDKRKQYQERGIPEYWLLNPETGTVEVLELKDGEYVEFGKFQGTTLVQSPSFEAISFTAEQVFAGT